MKCNDIIREHKEVGRFMDFSSLALFGDCKLQYPNTTAMHYMACCVDRLLIGQAKNNDCPYDYEQFSPTKLSTPALVNTVQHVASEATIHSEMLSAGGEVCPALTTSKGGRA